MYQRILGLLLLLAGVLYGAAIFTNTYRYRELLKRQKGALPFLAVMEILVYICASVGVSDYLLNTLLIKQGKYAGDREIPGTVVACGLVPGSIIAFSLLQAEQSPDFRTLLVCGICVSLGSITGGKLVGRFNSEKIKMIMRIALILSFLVLVGRMLFVSQMTGMATELPLPLLAVAGVLFFLTGAINMFGIPMKPTWTAMFLMMGLSPMVTLTLVLVIGSLSPLAGGVGVLKRGIYHRKMAFCAATFGSVGAVLGTAFAVSVSATVLNILLMAVMLLAIVVMFRN